MEIEKIRNMTEEELQREEGKVAEQIFRIRFAKSLGKLDGLKKLRALKLDMARFKTIARERQLNPGSALVAADAATTQGKV